MLTELMPLLLKCRLLLTISLVEGEMIRATLVPQKASETEDNALPTPLAITGTEPSPAQKKRCSHLEDFATLNRSVELPHGRQARSTVSTIRSTSSGVTGSLSGWTTRFRRSQTS
jgi:hypothetical protein